MNTPRTIAAYLAQLRATLRGADPALIQDALYDAEEHLRAELAEQPERGEAQMLEHVVGSYGAPDEVAARFGRQRHRRDVHGLGGFSEWPPIREHMPHCSTCCCRWRPASSISPG